MRFAFRTKCCSCSHQLSESVSISWKNFIDGWASSPGYLESKAPDIRYNIRISKLPYFTFSYRVWFCDVLLPLCCCFSMVDGGMFGTVVKSLPSIHKVLSWSPGPAECWTLMCDLSAKVDPAFYSYVVGNLRWISVPSGGSQWLSLQKPDTVSTGL